MKDYFNWIGCKSSKKERYIQLADELKPRGVDVNHLKKKGISNNLSVFVLGLEDVNHLKKKGISNDTKA